MLHNVQVIFVLQVEVVDLFMLTCSVLQNNLHSEKVSRQKVQYEDIFSPDIVKQKQVTELYIQLIEIREKLLNCSPVALTGPVH